MPIREYVCSRCLFTWDKIFQSREGEEEYKPCCPSCLSTSVMKKVSRLGYRQDHTIL